MSNMFLNQDELVALTGRRIKSKQIEALRRMGLPFWVNAVGKPVVSVAAIEGRKADIPKKPEPTWEPNRDPVPRKK
jgi:hypothetical protein